MTDKTFPIEFGVLVQEYVGTYPPANGADDLDEAFRLQPKPPFTRPDSGDYDSKTTTTLHWDTDFTPEQEIAWTRLIKRARRKIEALDEAGLDAEIGILKLWRDRTPGNETQEQLIAVLDAMTELWRLTLKEE